MKRLMILCIAVAAVATVAMFAAGFVAIWDAGNHKQQWKDTALLLMFVAVVFGSAAAFARVEVKR